MITVRRTQARTSQSRSFTGRKHRRVIIGVTAGILAVGSWIFALSSFTKLPAMTINTVQVYGIDSETGQTLQAAASSALKGTYLGMFSRANTIIYPRSDIVAAVVSATPRIETVSVERDGRNTVIVTVTEKAPIAVVCDDLPDWDGGKLVPSDRCYATDSTGRILSPATDDGSLSANRYYVPSLSDDAIGEYATTTDEFVVLEDFVRSVRHAEIEPIAVLIKENGEYELYVKNPGNEDGVTIVYFSTGGDVSLQLSNLSAFWNNTTADFEYIDVRYGSNVFYRTAGQNI